MSSADATDDAEESSANLLQWSDRWKDNRIGWHVADDAHRAMVAHGDALLLRRRDDDDKSLSASIRVFVPLCGKANDMAFLSRHEQVKEVVGVDGIRQALLEFAQEHPTLEIKQVVEEKQVTGGAYQVFKGNKITLLKGDFFHLTEQDTGGKFDAVFDRGSLVAIEPNLRESYVKIIGKVMAPGGKILLAAVEHDGDGGPPFHVDETEVRRLYQGQDWVSSIEQLNPEETEVDESERLDRFYMIHAK